MNTTRTSLSRSGSAIACLIWLATALPGSAFDAFNILWTSPCSQPAIAFSPDGSKLATCGGGVHLLNSSDGATLNNINGSFGGIDSLAFSPDNLFIAAGDADGKVYVWNAWDASTGWSQKVAGDVTQVLFTPGGELASWSSDRSTVNIWSYGGGALLNYFENDWAHDNVAFSPDGNLIALGGNAPDYSVRLVRIATGTISAVLSGHSNQVRSVKFSNDGQLIASGSDDGTIRLWRVSDTFHPTTLPSIDKQGVWELCLAANDTLLASTLEGKIGLWRVSDSKLLKTYAPGFLGGIAMSPAGDRIACTVGDQIVMAQNPAPAILQQPPSLTRFVGESAELKVAATGEAPLRYQWQFLGADIPGQTNDTLTLPNVRNSSAGIYSVRIFNSVSTLISATATLTVLPADIGPGSVDTTTAYDSSGNLTGPASGRATVFATLLQPDGKLLVAGDFRGINGKLYNGIARFKTDHTLDTSFNPGFGADAPVKAIALQRDGKIIVGGSFNTFDTRPYCGLARLYPDGSLDTRFTPDTNSADIQVLATGPTGQIWIGGRFASIAGQPRTNIARLTPVGALDTDFQSPSRVSGYYDWVTAIAPLSAGKALIGGRFVDPISPGAMDRNLVQLNPDGSLDSAFNCDLNGVALTSIAIRDNSSILVAGMLHSSAGGASHYFSLAELTKDGQVAREYSATNIGSMVNGMALQRDDRLVICGPFTTVFGMPRHGVARLNPDGSLDASFDPADAYDVNSNISWSGVSIQPDGRIWVAADSSEPVFATRALTLLNPDGRRDTSFLAQFDGNPGSITTFAADNAGRVLVGGVFSSFDGQPINNLARLDKNGRLDRTFKTFMTDRLLVRNILAQPDGKVLVSGQPDCCWDLPAESIMRFNTDGSLDHTFQYLSHPAANPGTILSTALQPDGKILICGEFNLPPRGLARLNSNGSLDTSFTPPDFPAWDGEGVHAIAVLPSKKILVGGTYLNEMTPSLPPSNLLRLNSDGSLDSTFSIPPPVYVGTIVPTPAGKWIVGGAVDEQGNYSLLLLDTEGNFEKLIPLSAPEPVNLWPLGVESDGHIVTSGYMTLFRFAPDGSVDPAFRPRISSQSSIIPLLTAPGGWTYAGGDLRSVNGIPVPAFARIRSRSAADHPFVERQLGNGKLVHLVAQPAPGVSNYAVEEGTPLPPATISHGGQYNSTTGKLTYGPFNDDQPRDLTYLLSAPPGAQGPFFFGGAASADSFTTPIVGDRSLRLWDIIPADGYLQMHWRPLSEMMVLQVTGSPEGSYGIQTSTDLKQWDPLTTVTNSAGFSEYPQAGPPGTKRFYRAVPLK